MLGHHALSEAPLSALVDLVDTGLQRSITDAAPITDAFTSQILRHRQQVDIIPMADQFFTTVVYQPTATANRANANRAKLIARPRWLFKANIGGARTYSSEDMETP